MPNGVVTPTRAQGRASRSQSHAWSPCGTTADENSILIKTGNSEQDGGSHTGLDTAPYSTTAAGQVRPSSPEATRHPAASCRSRPRPPEEGLGAEAAASSHRPARRDKGRRAPAQHAATSGAAASCRPQRAAGPGNLGPSSPRPGETPCQKSLFKKGPQKEERQEAASPAPQTARPGGTRPPTPGKDTPRPRREGPPAPPRPPAGGTALLRLSGRGGAGRAGPAGAAAAASPLPPVPAQAALAHAAQLLLGDDVGEGLGAVEQLAGPHPPAGAEAAALPRAREPLQRCRLHPPARAATERAQGRPARGHVTRRSRRHLS